MAVVAVFLSLVMPAKGYHGESAFRVGADSLEFGLLARNLAKPLGCDCPLALIAVTVRGFLLTFILNPYYYCTHNNYFVKGLAKIFFVCTVAI